MTKTPVRLVALTAVCVVLAVATVGCGLKGKPKPPAAEGAAAETLDEKPTEETTE